MFLCRGHLTLFLAIFMKYNRFCPCVQRKYFPNYWALRLICLHGNSITISGAGTHCCFTLKCRILRRWLKFPLAHFCKAPEKQYVPWLTFYAVHGDLGGWRKRVYRCPDGLFSSKWQDHQIRWRHENHQTTDAPIRSLFSKVKKVWFIFIYLFIFWLLYLNKWKFV